MEPWQQRVSNEQEILAVNITKLAAFIDTHEFEKLDSNNQKLLRAQLNLMDAYSSILLSRKALFLD